MSIFQNSFNNVLGIFICLFTFTVSTNAQTQPGVTLKVYDIQENMAQLFPLSGTPTPNLHEYRNDINYTGSFSNPTYSETYTNQYIVEVIGEIHAAAAGSYQFQLSSDDGSILTLNEAELINHDGLHGMTPPASATTTLAAGWHPFLLRSFQNTSGAGLKLEWKKPGDSTWSVVPQVNLRTEIAVLVSSPGKKNIIRPGGRAGNGQPLIGTHPHWSITDISINGFAPQVGGMAFLPNGDLLVVAFVPNRFNTNILTYNSHCRIYKVTGTSGSPASVTSTHVAGDGLAGSFTMSECTGMAVVNGNVYVALRDNIYQVSDTNSDGVYDTKTAIINTNWNFHNFHQFVFSIKHINEGGTDYLYGTLSTGVAQSTGLGVPNSHDYFGCMFRVPVPTVGNTSAVEYIAGGLRTPNGLSVGPEGRIFVSDNQGTWNPSNSITEIRADRFYGHYNPLTYPSGESPEIDPSTGSNVVASPNRYEHLAISPKSIQLPQNVISNSPTEGIMRTTGQYAGQMILGELTGGGMRRIFFDKVQGEYQGAVFRFAQGFEAGINRVIEGPDGSLYLGCMGSGGNWAWKGNLTGLMRFTPVVSPPETFEMKAVRAIPGGLEIEFTHPVPSSALSSIVNYTVKQWTYSPTSNYGGANVDESTVTPQSSSVSPDGTRVQLYLPNLKKGYVVYLTTDPVSTTGKAMWATEAWYTLNNKTASSGTSTNAITGRYEAEFAALANGPHLQSNHAGYTGAGFLGGMNTNALETITFTVNAPSAGDHNLTLRYARGTDAGLSSQLTNSGTLRVNVNGGENQTINLDAGTASWATWKDSPALIVSLNAGSNTIVITNPHTGEGIDGVCNFDRIDLNLGSATSPPATLALSQTTIPPGLPAGTNIAHLTGTDPDTGDALSYELGFNNIDFLVSGSTLALTRTLGTGTHAMAVRVIDSTGLYKESAFTINVADGPDSDNDNMDDNWETIFGLNPALDDAALDNDGDGRSNMEEYIALTSPNDSQDYYAVESVTQNGDNTNVTINSRLNRNYQLQKSSSLTNGSWSDVGSLIPGTGSPLQFSYDHSVETRVFLRVIVTKL
jgi:hypothetical protein